MRDALLLLPHAVLGLVYASVQRVVLLYGEVASLAILVQLLFFRLFFSSVAFAAKTEHFLLALLVLDYLTDQL